MKRFFTWLASLYASLLRSAGVLLAAAAGVLLFSAALTLPLWFTAVTFPRLYTAAVLAVTAAALVRLVVRRLAAASRKELAGFLRGALAWLFLLVCLYFLAGFIASSRFAAAAFTVLPTAAAAGYLFGGSPPLRRRS